MEMCLKNLVLTGFRRVAMLAALLSLELPGQLPAQTPATNPAIPDWAQPSSPTHVQVPPPGDFHRPSRNVNQPLGIFEGQSDVGAALVPGSANFNTSTGKYTITSAGYNIWYSRDEFHFLWKKISGDLSLAADVSFPDANGYDDRKAVLIIRQSLDDGSKEAMLGEHGTGMIHMAWRPETNRQMKDMQFRFGGTLAGAPVRRIGIEKHGDSISIFVSFEGEPMHQLSPPLKLPFEGPFYAGIGFCSHQPAKTDTAILSNVILENAAGKVH